MKFEWEMPKNPQPFRQVVIEHEWDKFNWDEEPMTDPPPSVAELLRIADKMTDEQLQRQAAFFNPNLANRQREEVLDWLANAKLRGRKATMQESIVSVAIMLSDKAFVAPTEQYQTWRHGDLMAEMARCGIPTPIIGVQGFQTDKTRFVDRAEALEIAKTAGQIIKKTGNESMLFSEDVW